MLFSFAIAIGCEKWPLVHIQVDIVLGVNEFKIAKTR